MPPIHPLAKSIAWFPAVRLGKEWQPYLDFDLGVVSRVNKVRVGQAGTIAGAPVRRASTLRILDSPVRNFVENLAVEKSLLANDDTIEFGSAVEARYFRIVIVEA